MLEKKGELGMNLIRPTKGGLQL